METHTVADVSPLAITLLRAVGFSGDGRPMVIYVATDPTSEFEQEPKEDVAWCNDPDCEDTDSVDISGRARLASPSFATSTDGRRYLAAGGPSGITLLECRDQYCPPTNGDLVLPGPDIGQPVLSFTPDGNPLLTLEELVNSGGLQPPRTDVWLAACSDPTCDQQPQLTQVLDTEPGVTVEVQPPLVTDIGLTVIVNARNTHGSEGDVEDLPDRVIVVGCDDHTCTNRTVNIIATGIQGAVAALGPDQLPRLAWTDPDQQITYYSRCADPARTTYTTGSLDITGQVRNLAITAKTTLLVTETSTELVLNVCPTDNCVR